MYVKLTPDRDIRCASALCSPCCTFAGEGEPFCREDDVQNLKTAGAAAESDVYPTDVHAFDRLYPGWEISRQAIAVFERHFENALRGSEEGEES